MSAKPASPVITLQAAADKAESIVQTIDCTPTWAAMLPVYRLAIEHANPKGRAIAWEELGRMAALADMWNEGAKLDAMRADIAKENRESDIADGEAAAKRGANVRACPYDHGSERACHWLQGYGAQLLADANREESLSAIRAALS